MTESFASFLAIGRVSCILKIVGFGRRPLFQALLAKQVWGISVYQKNENKTNSSGYFFFLSGEVNHDWL